jgi:hypothetical protein
MFRLVLTVISLSEMRDSVKSYGLGSLPTPKPTSSQESSLLSNLPTHRYANYRLLVEVLMQARFLQGTRQETSVGSEARAKAESVTGGHLGRNSQLLKPWLRSGPRARS